MEGYVHVAVKLLNHCCLVDRCLDLCPFNHGKMKEVTLIFPDNSALAEFVVKEQVNNAEADSHEQELTALLPDNKITAAENIYGAILKKMTPRN
jgi:hypothetical protein